MFTKRGLTMLSLLLMPVVVLIGLAMRTYPPGVDSYFFLLNARDGIISAMNPPVFQHIAEFTNGWGWIIIPALLIFINIIILYHIGKSFGLKNSEFAGLALFLSPIFVIRAIIFEDDILAYTYVLFAVFLWTKNKLLGALSILPLMFIWKGWMVLALLFAFLLLPEIPAAVMLIALSVYIVFTFLNTGVSEHIPLSLIVVFIFYPMLDSIIDMIKGRLDLPEDFQRWVIFSVGIGMVAMQFVVWATFPLVLLFLHTESWKKYGKELILSVILFLFIATSFVLVVTSSPSDDLMVCLDRDNITTDWSTGYWRMWLGYDAETTPFNPVKDQARMDVNYDNWTEDCGIEEKEVWEMW